MHSRRFDYEAILGDGLFCCRKLFIVEVVNGLLSLVGFQFCSRYKSASRAIKLTNDAGSAQQEFILA